MRIRDELENYLKMMARYIHKLLLADNIFCSTQMSLYIYFGDLSGKTNTAVRGQKKAKLINPKVVEILSSNPNAIFVFFLSWNSFCHCPIETITMIPHRLVLLTDSTTRIWSSFDKMFDNAMLHKINSWVLTQPLFLTSLIVRA